MAISMKMGVSMHERLRREWMEESERTFEKMFAADQQENLITFTQREDMAMELTRHLAQWLLEEHIGADPAAEPSQLSAPGQSTPCCPKCAKQGEAVTQEADPLPQRTVQSRAGDVGLERQQYKCTTCRVVFFPLGPEVGAWRRGI
jgi:hypothetical protein